MALLAEYDALRGLGHACGHCASGSSSVLAALALNEVRDQLDFGVETSSAHLMKKSTVPSV